MPNQEPPDETALDPIPTTAVQPVLNATTWDLRSLAMTAGTLSLSAKQKEILYAQLDEACVQIRPDDGVPYVSHVEVRKRFNEAFGGKWALVPLGVATKEGNSWIWNFILIVEGCFVSQAEGSMRDTNNKKMDRTDYAEGAKSNALMRCAKGMGLFPEMWDADWRNNWLKKWAISVKEKNYKGEMVDVWKKREPEEVVPITAAELYQLIQLTMDVKGDTLAGAIERLDAYWQKGFKESVLRARGVAAQKMIEKLVAEKEAAIAHDANARVAQQVEDETQQAAQALADHEAAMIEEEAAKKQFAE